jgi:hypothetical protein
MALRTSALEEGKAGLGYFATVAESAFARREDGALLCFPWGFGRGYLVRSEEEHLRLRRELAWLSRIGMFGFPVAVFFLYPFLGLLPTLAAAPILGLEIFGRVAWTTRRLVPSAEWLGWREGRARGVAAVRGWLRGRSS